MLVYLCPSDKKYTCSWEGPAEDILRHFEEEHDELLHFNDTFGIDLLTPSENRLMFIDEEIYLTQITVADNKLEIKLRYLGPQTIAKKITYNILLRFCSGLNQSLNITAIENGSIIVDLCGIPSEINYVSCTLNINKDRLQETEDIFGEYVNNHEVSIQHSVPDVSRKYSLREHSSTIVVKTTESSLTRSKTISLEEIKRRHLKRAKSTVSLGAITEDVNDSNCTDCGITLSPPIFLCPCGHSFCSGCQNSVCRLCLEKVTFERNYHLEEKFNKFLVPCKYKKNGCPEKLIYSELANHIKTCTFCDYTCPVAGCFFEGQYKHTVKHLKIIHGATKMLDSSFIVVFQNIPEAFLVNEEKGIFHCIARYLEDSVVWEAQFCGPKERVFFCELKFKEGKLKQPLFLNRNENFYSTEMTFQELKKMKIKAKNAILTITC
ncbi:unnamed protein product [Phyllotreta striolata]|uniref:SIAH-type domain-containing protein n=1 Tax=Phyllotreta striolata TaxID=444603 RepID=A0A9N9TMP2_PHYSR|nr:unnamed protein product [Phyllotreta striolata]